MLVISLNDRKSLQRTIMEFIENWPNGLDVAISGIPISMCMDYQIMQMLSQRTEMVIEQLLKKAQEEREKEAKAVEPGVEQGVKEG